MLSLAPNPVSLIRVSGGASVLLATLAVKWSHLLVRRQI